MEQVYQGLTHDYDYDDDDDDAADDEQLLFWLTCGRFLLFVRKTECIHSMSVMLVLADCAQFFWKTLCCVPRKN